MAVDNPVPFPFLAVPPILGLEDGPKLRVVGCAVHVAERRVIQLRARGEGILPRTAKEGRTRMGALVGRSTVVEGGEEAAGEQADSNREAVNAPPSEGVKGGRVKLEVGDLIAAKLLRAVEVLQAARCAPA